MRRASIIALLVAIAVVVLIGVLLWGRARRPAATKPAPVLSVPVRVAPVSRGPISHTLLVTGSLRTDDEVAVSSKVLGKVARVLVKEGDHVSKGQLLLALDPTDFQAALSQAQAGLRTAQIRYDQAKRSEQLRDTETRTAIEQARQAVEVNRARLAQAQAAETQAKAELTRWQRLHESGAVSAQELDTKRTAEETARAGVAVAQQTLAQSQQALQVAQASTVQYQLTQEDIKAAAEAVRQAQAQVVLAREQLSDARIISSISGVVYQRQVDVGETVTPGQPFMNLAGLRSVYFEAQVPETEVTSLGVGSPVQVTVDAFPGRGFRGRVARIIPVVTTSTRDFRVRVSVAQEGDLLSPGAFARGNILVGRHPQALLVSKDAIQTALGETYVFVVVEGRARRVPVRLGWSDDRNAEVLSGVNDGDVVVVAGGSTLRDGDHVTVH